MPATLVSPNCDADADRAPIEAELPDPGFEQRITRRYRKTRKQPVPHTWRTRPDPFDGVWASVVTSKPANDGHRLPGILGVLRGMDSSHLDRQAVEQLFGVGERRARFPK